MSGLPSRTYDLPAGMYPILIEYLHADTGELVDSVRIERPPPGERAKVCIPPLKRILGHSVAVRFTYGDGTVEEGGV